MVADEAGRRSGCIDRPLVVALNISLGLCSRLEEAVGAGMARVAADGGAIRLVVGEAGVGAVSLAVGDATVRGIPRSAGAGEPSTDSSSLDALEMGLAIPDRLRRPGVPSTVSATREMAGAGAEGKPFATDMVALRLASISFEEFCMASTTACKLDDPPWSCNNLIIS